MTKHDKIKDIILESRNLKDKILKDSSIIKKIEEISQIIFNKLQSGGKLVLAGNGGSAADCQHIAAELVCRFEKERPPQFAIALTTDTSILTAISNDYSFENIFSRQIDALCNSNDVFIGITTSGKSKNILKALDTAKNKGLFTICLCGNVLDLLKENSDEIISIPSVSTARIQECHIMILHIICSIIDDNFN